MARKSKATNVVSGNARVGIQVGGDVHGDITVHHARRNDIPDIPDPDMDGLSVWEALRKHAR
ncbi:hypothetical protein AB0I28_31470 [Phytomonospora sp. NPDC050363]|uniref:hypothetical protein n=1 Tax=Phytomonospora sp. NPDC050363 TaxID=3155642 RepID=UPI0033C8B8E6